MKSLILRFLRGIRAYLLSPCSKEYPCRLHERIVPVHPIRVFAVLTQKHPRKPLIFVPQPLKNALLRQIGNPKTHTGMSILYNYITFASVYEYNK